MIELSKHIEILLIDHDCVIVPDLGGFVAHHVAARVGEDNLFLPPLRTLGFNPQLKINDSLLAQSYIEAYDISYPEAIRRIEEEVAELKQHLSINGEYELEDVGVLSLNSDNQFIFEPCEAGLLTPDLYALSSFAVATLAKQASLPMDMAESQADGAGNEHEFLDNQSRNDVSEDDLSDDDDAKVVSIRLSWIRNFIAVAAAIIAFFYVAPPVSNGNMENARYGNIYNASVLNLITPDIPTAKDIDSRKHHVTTLPHTQTDSIANNLVSDASDVSSGVVSGENADSVAVNKVQDFKYCLVLASMIPSKNAKKFVEQLHAKGFTDAREYLNKDTLRVVYGSYDSITDAYNALNRLRNNADFEQAWVYKKR